MREALRKCANYLDIGDAGLCASEVRAMYEVMQEALSTPARNCDLYATQLQMSEAYEEYRKSAMKKRGSGIVNDVPYIKPPPMSYDEWMFATPTN
jgi:hypothetical protein